MRNSFILFLLLFFHQFVTAASFDCNKAQAPIEHAICHNESLSTADTLLAERYKALRQSLSKSESNILKQEQRNWLKQRLTQCSVYDVACLENLYTSRITEFESRLGVGNTLSVQSAAQPLDDFIPEGYKILDTKKGDLNRDQFMDVILILQQEDEQDDSEVVRPLLILIGDANNQLQLAARNDNVVLCESCGGMFGDPYQTTTIKNGYFTVEHYGGSAWRWTKYITFEYITEQNNWFLHKITEESYHTADPDNVNRTTQTVEQFGAVFFEDYQNE